MDNMIIRNIEEKDHYEVEHMTQRAFWNVNMPGCDEHYLVHRVWNDPSYIPEISLLAEKEGKVIGAILYARAHIETQAGSVETILFGPLCVDPDMQRRGIGAALLKSSMEKAKEYGYESILICGVPEYYPRFGFVPASQYGITMPDGSSFDAFMAFELKPGSLSSLAGGKFFEPPVFDCDIHDEEYMKSVDQFSEQFPYMEKLVLPTQWR